jgi:hypothetical protein
MKQMDYSASKEHDEATITLRACLSAVAIHSCPMQQAEEPEGSVIRVNFGSSAMPIVTLFLMMAQKLVKAYQPAKFDQLKTQSVALQMWGAVGMVALKLVSATTEMALLQESLSDLRHRVRTHRHL